MNMSDYDIVVHPTNIIFPEDWKSALDKYLSDEISLEEYLEEDYRARKQEYARQLMKSIL